MNKNNDLAVWRLNIGEYPDLDWIPTINNSADLTAEQKQNLIDFYHQFNPPAEEQDRNWVAKWEPGITYAVSIDTLQKLQRDNRFSMHVHWSATVATQDGIVYTVTIAGFRAEGYSDHLKPLSHGQWLEYVEDVGN